MESAPWMCFLFQIAIYNAFPLRGSFATGSPSQLSQLSVSPLLQFGYVGMESVKITWGYTDTQQIMWWNQYQKAPMLVGYPRFRGIWKCFTIGFTIRPSNRERGKSLHIWLFNGKFIELNFAFSSKSCLGARGYHIKKTTIIAAA